MKPQAALLTAAVTLLPGLAIAHPGHHEQMTAAQAAQHLTQQPDHLALLAIGVLVMAFGLARVLAPVRK